MREVERRGEVRRGFHGKVRRNEMVKYLGGKRRGRRRRRKIRRGGSRRGVKEYERKEEKGASWRKSFSY